MFVFVTCCCGKINILHQYIYNETPEERTRKNVSSSEKVEFSTAKYFSKIKNCFFSEFDSHFKRIQMKRLIWVGVCVCVDDFCKDICALSSPTMHNFCFFSLTKFAVQLAAFLAIFRFLQENLLLIEACFVVICLHTICTLQTESLWNFIIFIFKAIALECFNGQAHCCNFSSKWRNHMNP